MASASSSTLSFFLLFVLLSVVAKAQREATFTYPGFSNINETELILEGATIIKSSGLLRLTNSSNNIAGRVFHSQSIQMLSNSTPHRKASSFSTSFVFSIVSSTSGSGGFGLAFTIAPKTHFPEAEAEHFLGLFNRSNDENPSNHIFAVEFDTVNGAGKGESDTKGDHIGVNLNGVTSVIDEPAAYVIEQGPYARKKENISLEQDDAVQAWIDFDGDEQTVNVTIAPIRAPKPFEPLISNHPINLAGNLTENVYVGFSASTGKHKASSHYILGWSFAVNAPAPSLDIEKLPRPPPKVKDTSSFPWVNFAIGVLSALTLLLLFCLCSVTLYKRYTNFEALEDWELDCPHRFRYRDLHTATKGFKESELIGVGGFGAVYKGVLPSTGTEVAVKRIVRNPIQGMREFAAEIESLGRLRHKNLVNLQGWCKQENNLLLVYDYIPNGSLDSLLYNQSFVLDWDQRFNIIKGIANGLLYLHEEWEQVVVHRDIKTSNILIDGDFNPRLGDFGLARLYDHGEVSRTTNVVGTIGYIAPELTRTGKASTCSDAYAYGVLLLEVVSGRRPIGPEQFVLVDWVIENYRLGQILEVIDPNLNSVCAEEVELVLKLGLLCSQFNAESRPTMRQVTRYLNFDDPLPNIAGIRHKYSLSSRMSLDFLEGESTSAISTSLNLSSINDMTSMSIEAGR
ncbi:probable L-type lectin-domain containing receptor kinase VI.1 [Neltuma alba]|uniref:probable L-type lectin-domain containing receptor kinase VI.1 n=1 Tax=Neltuma alba TaxID=207710 RepID=UPI0010A57FD0|nr:probable L-type lectin-domain containing receptor kinase VI.1 [Prosopis alba]